MRSLAEMPSRRGVAANALVVVLTAAAVFFYGVTNPAHNWDIIGYVAAAHYEDGLRGESLRETTYADVRKEVGPFMFEHHTTAGPYRQTVYGNFRALEQQVPFYRVKVAYVELVRAAGRLGLTYPQATVWVSALFAASCVVLLGLFTRTLALPSIVVPLVAFGAGLPDLARASVPDAPAGFFSLLATLLALKRSRWVYPVSAILPLLRTDHLIVSALLMAHAYWRGARVRAAITLVVALAVYAYVNRAWGGYGWLTLFNFSFITGAVPFPAEMDISRRIADYLLPYARLWIFVLQGHQPVIYCLGAFALALGLARQMTSRGRWIFFVIPLSFVAAHLLLFPLYEDRYFCYSASLVLLGLFALLRGRTAGPPGRGAQ